MSKEWAIAFSYWASRKGPNATQCAQWSFANIKLRKGRDFFPHHAIVSAVLLYCLSFTFVDTHGDFKVIVECSLCTVFSKLSRFRVARFSRTYCFVGITRVHDIYDEWCRARQVFAIITPTNGSRIMTKAGGHQEMSNISSSVKGGGES